MAELIIKTKNITSNIRKINEMMHAGGYQWSLVTKLMAGNRELLAKILRDDLTEGIHSIGDSRLSGLKNIKKINPHLRTVYIKPPARNLARQVVEWADISMNTSLETIRVLNHEAARQNKIHEIIIMIELGELREGVLRNKLFDFYKSVFDLEHIKVIGIGSNLGCMYGIEPSYDKLMQLSLYRKLLELGFQREIPLVSGGTSITLPLIQRRKIPGDMNHFRIGEAAFFGTSPLNNKKYRSLSTDTFQFNANILEQEMKDMVPDGQIGEGNIGHTMALSSDDSGKKSCRVLVDFGMLDVEAQDLRPKDPGLRFVGTTSDLSVYELDEGSTAEKKRKFRVGNTMGFTPNYMAVARLMNSRFVDISVT